MALRTACQAAQDASAHSQSKAGTWQQVGAPVGYMAPTPEVWALDEQRQVTAGRHTAGGGRQRGHALRRSQARHAAQGEGGCHG